MLIMSGYQAEIHVYLIIMVLFWNEPVFSKVGNKNAETKLKRFWNLIKHILSDFYQETRQLVILLTVFELF